MTIILTVSCKEGIILFSDRRLSNQYGTKSSEICKLIPLGENLVCSFHGLPKIEDNKYFTDVIPLLFERNNSLLDIHEVADVLFGFLKKQNSKDSGIDETGFHLAGFDLSTHGPIVYHIFFKIYPNKNEVFDKELYNDVYHNKEGKKIRWNSRRNYFPLFNGANELVFQLQNMEKHDYSKLNFDGVIKIAKRHLAITCYTKPFSKICGDGINFVEITKDGRSEIKILKIREPITIPDIQIPKK